MTTLLLDPTLRRARIAGATVAALFAVFAAVVTACAIELCSVDGTGSRSVERPLAGQSSSRQPAAGSCPPAGRRGQLESDPPDIDRRRCPESSDELLIPELTVFVDPSVHGAAESIRRHARQITTVALPGLRLGEDGTLTDQLDRSLLRLAHNEGLRTTAVLRDGDARRPGRVHSLAHDRAARSRLAEQLVGLCEAERLQGIHLAFDDLRDDWRDLEPITADLGRRLRRAQVELFVDVPPGIDGATLTALARLANGVVLMAFDEYDASGPAGPIASDAFVESALRSASARAPAAKLTAALALHGYEWPSGAPGRRVSFGQARALARNAQTSLRREGGNLHLQFGDGDAHHESWVADAVSVSRQSHIAAAAKIRSLAFGRSAMKIPRCGQPCGTGRRRPRQLRRTDAQ